MKKVKKLLMNMIKEEQVNIIIALLVARESIRKKFFQVKIIPNIEVLNVLTGFKFIGEKIKSFEENNEKTYLIKYDKEFKSILNSEQKGKYNTVRKMEKKEVKYCIKNKAFYKRDPKLRPFGEKMYSGEQNEVLCPKHNKWHLFGYKHKID